MGPIKEFVCFAHGKFDSDKPVCPAGCTTSVEREFRTAPAGHSARTKAADAALERLATRFGMTDISNRSGTVAASRTPGAPPALDFTPIWKEVPKGDVLEVGRGIVSREGSTGGAEAASREYGTGRMGDEPYATQEVPLPVGGKLPQLRPHIVANDNTSAADFSKAIASAA